MSGSFAFFECGNGDTIVVNAGNEWGLVDCNLIGTTQERLRRYFRDNHIERLRFVIVTHFDRDHVQGMARFLSAQFGPGSTKENGTKRETWDIEQLILPLPLGELAENLKAIYALHEILIQYKGGSCQYCNDAKELLELGLELQECRPARDGVPRLRDYQPGTCLDGELRFGQFEVVFLAPAQEIAARFVRWFRQAFAATDRYFELKTIRESIGAELVLNENDRRLADVFHNLKRRAKTERFWDTRRPGWNESTIVVAFRRTETNQTILLCGDMPKRRWKGVRSQWRRFCAIGSISPETEMGAPFDVVKASHHGSKVDHIRDLYEDFVRRIESITTSIVVVSADRKDIRHPHRSVVDDWHNLGWRVWHTGLGLIRREGGVRRGFPGGQKPISGVKVRMDGGRITPGLLHAG